MSRLSMVRQHPRLKKQKRQPKQPSSTREDEASIPPKKRASSSAPAPGSEKRAARRTTIDHAVAEGHDFLHSQGMLGDSRRVDAAARATRSGHYQGSMESLQRQYVAARCIIAPHASNWMLCMDVEGRGDCWAFAAVAGTLLPRIWSLVFRVLFGLFACCVPTHVCSNVRVSHRR